MHKCMERLEVPFSVLASLMDRSVEAMPREACGLLVAGADGLELVEARNVSPFPTLAFELDPEVVCQRYEQIVAIWHSHPIGPAVPSATDMQLGRGLAVIVAPGISSVRAWRLLPGTGPVEVALVVSP